MTGLLFLFNYRQFVVRKRVKDISRGKERKCYAGHPFDAWTVAVSLSVWT